MIFHGVYRSQALQMNTHLSMILPEDIAACRGTLILLHGLSGACEDWTSKSSIARYAQKYNLAVFIPEVQRAWYTNMKNGLKYFDFVSTELPAWIEKSFRLPCDREHLMIGGLSMGGYGAMKCALTYPERFGRCIALSARHFIDRKLDAIFDNLQSRAEFQGIFGEDLTIPDADKLPHLVQSFDQLLRPRFYVACGQQDFLYEESVDMQSMLKDNGFDVLYEEWEGIHDWYFWDAAIQRALGHFLD